MGTTVEDVMTPDPTTLPPTSTVRDAYALMTDRGFRHVPVVEGDVLLGIVSMTDIGHLGAKVEEVMARPLFEVMSTKLVTVKPGEKIEVAAATMASRRINCLLVVVGTQLSGIVTKYDLLDALARRVRGDE